MAGTVRVAVTGAAGQVAYAMLGRLASGEVFGPDTQVILHLLEITPALPALEGVAMELDDCSFSTLKDIVITDNAEKAFDGCNYALLVGSFPRKAGMERKELLDINGKIFVGQGKALAAKAASDVRILVVGNPCNTNCLVARSNGRSIPAERWTAMTRLDHNRARTALAKKAGVSNSDVTQMTIWGNHSNTQFPDFSNAKINGMSSAMSAANGAIDHVKSMIRGTPANDWVSMAVVSQGEYGVPKDMVFGYPCTTDGKGNYKVVDGLKLDAYGQAKFQTTLQELLEEKDAVKDLIPS